MTATVVLPTACFAPASRYALLATGADAVVADGQRYDKRSKATHRFTIADTRGRLTLTVPLTSPATFPCRWSDVRVSDHGRWTRTLPTALESAYGRTPYFEFYIDSLLPLIASAPGRRLTDFNRDTEDLMCRFFGITPPRHSDDPSLRPAAAPPDIPTDKTYWQLRADTLGFIPGLSALDLLFNLGPEAALYLKKA